jgi:micrococcal nuclease
MIGSSIRFSRRWGLLAITAGLICLTAAGFGIYQWLGGAQRPAGETRYSVASADNGDAINPFEITVIDGDTIKARGRTIRLVGFDAPEVGSQAKCAREREIGARAATQLKTLIAGGGLELRLIPCTCRSGTDEAPECNNGGACAQLFSYGRDIGALMIQYVLARPHVCSAGACPPRGSWC